MMTMLDETAAAPATVFRTTSARTAISAAPMATNVALRDTNVKIRGTGGELLTHAARARNRAGSYAVNVQTASAMASLLLSSAVASMLSNVSHEEW